MKIGGAVLGVALVFVLAWWTAFIMDAAEDYVPTDIEKLRLDNIQKDLVIREQAIALKQTEITSLRAQSRALLENLYDEAERVRTAHQWPDTIRLNPNTMRFEQKSEATLNERPK